MRREARCHERGSQAQGPQARLSLPRLPEGPMSAGGVLLVIAGIWVVAQVLGGDALKRIGVIKP